MSACESHLNISGFYHTALGPLMDSLIISSTPNLEPQRHTSRFMTTESFPGSRKEEFFSVGSSGSLNSEKESKHNGRDAPETENPAASSAGETPKRTIAAARKQRLFTETEEFQPRTRMSNIKDLTPQSQLLKKAIMRMECLQRRQERIALSKKPARTSLRV